MRVYRDTDSIRLYRGSVTTEGGCVIVARAKSPDGYGTFGIRNEKGESRTVPAHTAAWELVNGPRPEGYILDHTCHDPAVCKVGKACPHRACINVEHLALVTRPQNSARGRQHRAESDWTHCLHGHEFTPENTYVTKKGTRACRECRRRWAQEQNAKPEVRSRQNAWRRGNPDYLAKKRAARAAAKARKDTDG